MGNYHFFSCGIEAATNTFSHRTIWLAGIAGRESIWKCAWILGFGRLRYVHDCFHVEIICIADDPAEAVANYFILKLLEYPDVKVLVYALVCSKIAVVPDCCARFRPARIAGLKQGRAADEGGTNFFVRGPAY